MTVQMLHGTTRKDWAPHIGVCLTDDEAGAMESAAIHGGAVRLMGVDIDMTGLVVVDKTDMVDRDSQFWPGDTQKSIAALRAEGVDVVTYDDETESGSEMKCWRIISDRALAAISAHYECEI